MPVHHFKTIENKHLDLAELRLAYKSKGENASPPPILKKAPTESKRSSPTMACGMVRERSSSQLRNVLTTTSRNRMDSERYIPYEKG